MGVFGAGQELTVCLDYLMRIKSIRINYIYILWLAVVGQKRCYFENRTGEVTEKKESARKTEPDRTGERSGEVVENT